MSTKWTDRIWHEFRIGNLTRAFRDVLLTLRTYRGAGGLICPSHATLAERAGCSAETARRALRHANSLALVSWTERRVRRGWRWLRTSNRYQLTLPDGPAEAGKRPSWWRRATNQQSDRGGEIKENQDRQPSRKAALAAMLREASGLPDLLAARRRVIEARLLTGKGA